MDVASGGLELDTAAMVVVVQFNSVFNDFFHLLWVSAYVPTHGQFFLYFSHGAFDPASAWVFLSPKTAQTTVQENRKTLNPLSEFFSFIFL
jgi:hypothetical protein